jgi:hypothetical protein
MHRIESCTNAENLIRAGDNFFITPNVPGICSLSSDEKCMWAGFLRHRIELEILRLPSNHLRLSEVNFRCTSELHTPYAPS